MKTQLTEEKIVEIKARIEKLVKERDEHIENDRIISAEMTQNVINSLEEWL